MLGGHIHNSDTLKYVLEKSRNLLPVVVSGGIGTIGQAKEMLAGGASMIAVGSFLRNGPHFIRRSLKSLVPKKNK